MAAGEQADGARDAAGISAGATRQSVAEQRRQYDQSRADLAPYRDFGTNALAEYSALFGIGRTPASVTGSGEAKALAELEAHAAAGYPHGDYGSPAAVDQQIAMFRAKAGQQQTDSAASGEYRLSSEEMQSARDRFQETPGYQFRFDEGTRALDRSAAARGGLRGGGFARELTRYGQGIASDEFNNYANRLAGLAGMGQGSTTATATLGAQSANSIGNTMMAGAGQQGNAMQNAATARASGYAGAANAVSGGISNYAFYNAMQG
jgi:hypothetical protein